MARTKQTARISTGGKAPRKQLLPGIHEYGKHIKGSAGAQSILKKMKPHYRRLYLTHTALGTQGLLALCQGLIALRGRKQYKHSVMWEIHLGHAGVADQELAHILDYAVRSKVRQLYLDGNQIQLAANPETLIASFNSSALTEISLADNVHLASAGIALLFAELSVQTLRKINLSGCRLAATSIYAIASYLGDPRSLALEDLNLENNDSELEPLKHIVDTIKKRNFSLLELRLPWGDFEWKESRIGMPIHARGEHAAKSVEFDLLADCLWRNGGLFRRFDERVGKAALRCLAYSRIILNARTVHMCRFNPLPPSSTPAERRAWRARKRSPSPSKLLDLPIDILDLVLRYATGDPAALSRDQFARVQYEADGKDRLRAIILAGRGKSDSFRREWLRWAGLHTWEEDAEL